LFFSEFVSTLEQHCYLPGYGLTGWALRFRQNLRLPDKHPNTIEAEYERLRDRIGPCRLPSGESVQPYPPQHVGHISDHSIDDKQDTYLLALTDPIDQASVPSGLIRTSSSANLRVRFELRDEEVLNDVAGHLSSLLRTAFYGKKIFNASIFSMIVFVMSFTITELPSIARS
jgi:hypothetical protein